LALPPLPPQRSQHLFWHKRSSKTPAVASSSILTPTVKISGAGNSYTDGGYWRNGNATLSAESEPYRYHGGPKSND
jgi:hypothetical protein